MHRIRPDGKYGAIGIFFNDTGRTSNVRSLVIEDEPEIGAYVTRLLGQLHAVVDVVESVADARQALHNFRYDLAIVDRMLPDGDALEIVSQNSFRLINSSPNTNQYRIVQTEKLISSDPSQSPNKGMRGSVESYGSALYNLNFFFCPRLSVVDFDPQHRKAPFLAPERLSMLRPSF
jgi:CheY-like chemotaxis protein